jgi:hypothetical protein
MRVEEKQLSKEEAQKRTDSLFEEMERIEKNKDKQYSKSQKKRMIRVIGDRILNIIICGLDVEKIDVEEIRSEAVGDPGYITELYLFERKTFHFLI